MKNDTQVPSMHVGQMWALYRRWKYYHAGDGFSFLSFLKRAEPTFLMDDAVVVKSHDMWLVAEVNSNGELHS